MAKTRVPDSPEARERRSRCDIAAVGEIIRYELQIRTRPMEDPRWMIVLRCQPDGEILVSVKRTTKGSL